MPRGPYRSDADPFSFDIYPGLDADLDAAYSRNVLSKVARREERLQDSTVTVEPEQLVDPDPFTIGLGIFGAIAGGGAFLEQRRQRQLVQEQQRGAFRAAWFAARRTLIHFKQQIDEFETYMLEDGYGQRQFRIGSVRLVVDRGRHQAMRRLRGQTLITANRIGDDLDDLSEHLGPEHAEEVQRVLRHLDQITVPETYRSLIHVAREAFAVYEAFLARTAEAEGFETRAD
jgi:hypothetical protein